MDSPLRGAAARISPALRKALEDGWDPRIALEAIVGLVAAANRSVAEVAPWTLAGAERAGDPDARARLDAILWELAECLRIVAEALRPFLPDSAERIDAQLGVCHGPEWIRDLEWGGLPPGTRVGELTPLFPRRAASDAGDPQTGHVGPAGA